MYEIVEVQLGGPVVEIFDLATAAGIDSFRLRSDVPIEVSGQSAERFMHYVTEVPDATGDLVIDEWLIGPGFDVRIMTSEGWVVPGELVWPPWLFADPAYVYAQASAALEHMSFVRWDLVEGRDVGVFSGGPDAYAAYWGDTADEETIEEIEIWMNVDCYPMRVSMHEGDAEVFNWLLFDLGADIKLDIPADMLP